MKKSSLEWAFFFLNKTWRKACVSVSYVVQKGGKKVKHAPSSVCTRSIFNWESVGRCRDVGWEERTGKNKKLLITAGVQWTAMLTPWSCVCSPPKKPTCVCAYVCVCVCVCCVQRKASEEPTAGDLGNLHQPVNRSHIWELVPQHARPHQGLSLATPAAELGQGLTHSHRHRMYTAALAAWWSRENADRGRNGAWLVYSRSALLTMHHCCLMWWSKG